jgi:hypothetical protein
MFVAFVHPDYDGRPVSLFIKSLRSLHWIISDTKLSFPVFGDLVASASRLLIGVHSNTDSTVGECCVPTPPFRRPAPLSTYLWASFNESTYAVSRAPSSPRFNEDLCIDDTLVQNCKRKDPLASETVLPSLQSQTDYCLHRHGSDTSIQRGAEVVSVDHYALLLLPVPLPIFSDTFLALSSVVTMTPSCARSPLLSSLVASISMTISLISQATNLMSSIWMLPSLLSLRSLSFNAATNVWFRSETQTFCYG